ncbi:MAG TPA: hypothetical protein VGQ83_21985, partial [Polyangia bacterium]
MSRAALARRTGRIAAEFGAFALLLFATRFLAQGHLLPCMDQECHLGGIAVDVLANGVRFPLATYAPNDYDNGSFFSGLLTAAAFALLGRNVLAAKLVTHVFAAVGAVASLYLLRTCLRELRVEDRWARWAAIAAVVIGTAFAPRVVTTVSLVALGNHAEGAAINLVLLALFVTRRHDRSAALTATFWALVGFALYVNKGTFLAVLTLGAAEATLSRHSARRLTAAVAGLGLGALPEIVTTVQRHGLGWVNVLQKSERNVQGFPRAALSSLSTFADGRIELLVAWALALAVGIVLAWRSRSVATAVVAGFTVFYLAALGVMAQGGLDPYVVYGHPLLVVLIGLTVAVVTARARARWGPRAAVGAALGLSAVVLVACRPAAVSWDPGRVTALWRDRAAAACSWRLAEGFAREHRAGRAAAGRTQGQHMIARCRSLSEPEQVADCIGGIARELHWRHGAKVDGGEAPGGLTETERL